MAVHSGADMSLKPWGWLMDLLAPVVLACAVCGRKRRAAELVPTCGRAARCCRCHCHCHRGRWVAVRACGKALLSASEAQEQHDVSSMAVEMLPPNATTLHQPSLSLGTSVASSPMTSHLTAGVWAAQETQVSREYGSWTE